MNYDLLLKTDTQQHKCLEEQKPYSNNEKMFLYMMKMVR